MKLYEYNVTVSVGFVVATESEEDARRCIDGWSTEGIVCCGDIIGAGGGARDIELQEERELCGDDPFDEAHDVVAPQESEEDGEKQQATQAIRKPEEPASAHA